MGIFTRRFLKRRLIPRAHMIDQRQIKAGATFARMNARQVVETARILSIETRDGGVPHVRYNCRLHRAGSTVFEDGPRTLALPTFLERFETVAPADGSPVPSQS